MNYRIFLILLFLPCLTPSAAAQTESATETVDSANVEALLQDIALPYLKIVTTDGTDPTFAPVTAPEGCMGQSITANDYVSGRIYLMQGANTLYDSGEYADDRSGMRVRVRGNTSSTYNADYPSLKIKLEKKADLLRRSDKVYRDKNWALLNYVASIELKTQVGFQVARLARAEWEPACEFVNVLLNGRYLGLYLLAETVKDGEARCDIAPSGYLVEADPYWWNTDEPYFHTDALSYAIGYTFKYPDGDDLDEELIERIESFILAFENALLTNADVSEYIDLESFAAWMVTHDVLGTSDGAGSNLFVYKYDYNPDDPMSTKLRMGPVWDLNSAFRRTGEWSQIHASDFYFDRLFEREDFVKAYKAKWAELRGTLYDEAAHAADSIATAFGAAANRSRQLTEALTLYPAISMEDNVEEVKTWFAERIPWMDEAVEGLEYTLGVSYVRPDGVPVKVKVYDPSGTLCADYRAATAKEARAAVRNGLPRGCYILHYLTAEGATATTEKLLVP